MLKAVWLANAGAGREGRRRYGPRSPRSIGDALDLLLNQDALPATLRPYKS